MIELKMDKPASCIYCQVRMSCKSYTDWLTDLFKRHPEKLMFKDECLLVDLDKYEDDLK